MTTVIVNCSPDEGTPEVAGDSRERMVASAVSLIATHGVSATSFSDVLAASGAPRGSIYHHFPDGKDQLTREALAWTAQWLMDRQRASAPTTPGEVVAAFTGLWRLVVLASGGASGCAIAGVALDTDASDPVRMDPVREAFHGWLALLREQLVATGLEPGRAASVATTALAGMEGALILCRVERDVGPLDTVAAELQRLVGTS